MGERGRDQPTGDSAALERRGHLGMMQLQHIAHSTVLAARERAADRGFETARIRVVDDVDRRCVGHGREGSPGAFDRIRPSAATAGDERGAPVTSRAYDVICLGHAALDRVYTVDAIPSVPTKVRARAYRESGGGMASNAACAIARLGGRVAFWGRAGDDAAGAAIAHEFAAYGVDASHFRRLPGHRSSQSAIVVDGRGERLVVSHHGDVPEDAAWLPLDDMPGTGAVLADVRWLTGARALFNAARDAGVPRDPRRGRRGRRRDPRTARRWPTTSCSRSTGSRAGHRCPSAFRTAQRVAALEQAWRAMHSGANTASRACAVTCGEAGSWWLTDAGRLHVAAPAIDAVDTLGAGDVFHGAYALAIAEGQEIASAARFATLAAALKCTRPGGRAGSPTRAEVGEFAAGS